MIMAPGVRRSAAWVALACLLGSGALSAAQEPAAGAGIDSDQVTVITSERLTFDYRKQYAVFEENVVVTDPEMRLTSSRLAVWFDDAGEVELIKAEGDVYIEQEGTIATAGEATYEVATGKIVLVQEPRLQRGRHYLEATTITYWRNEELLIAEPQPRLVIYPEQGGDRINILGQ